MIGRCVLVAAALSGVAQAGGWAQAADHGISINSVGMAEDSSGDARLLFESYAEAGLGDRFTAIFTFESEVVGDSAMYGFRGGGGLRYSFAPPSVDPWQIGLEARITYQDYGSAIADPVFAGDGVGAVLQVDAGRAFQIGGRHAFANLSAGWVWRGDTADEWRLSATAGLDLSAAWQAGIAYFSTYAPGDLYDPGAYEKHEVQASLRWTIDADYALSLSVSRTVAAERTPKETTLRLAIWTFLYPDPDED